MSEDPYSFFDDEKNINFDKLIDNYKAYVKKRSFKYFREKNEKGEYISLKESALAYSFETYIQTLLEMFDGRSYLEAHSGLGRPDLIINIKDREYILEFKIFRDLVRFRRGKKQIAYYCKSMGVQEGIYLVFVPNIALSAGNKKYIKESLDDIDGVAVRTYIVLYDEEKDF